MRASRLAAVVLVVVLVAVIGVGAATSRSGSARRAAPALPAHALQPPAVTLASLHGHPALVNFWASWCHPCAKEAPQLTRLARDRSVRLVSIDTGDDAADARHFVARYGWRFPVLRDGDGSARVRYGITGLPTTFALDAHGRIVRTLTGPQTVGSLKAALRAAQ
jgi:thiol-disulfide isomerase/thioredoxin